MKLYVGGVCQGQEELARSENPGCEIFADFHETIRTAVLRDGQEPRKYARRFCEEQGESFAGTQKSLLKAMAEEGLILPGTNQNTKPLRLGTRQKRVIFLRKDKAEAIRDAPM